MIDWHNPSTLTDALKKLGMTQKRLAEVSGVSRTSLFRIIHGKGAPNWGTQRKVEEALAKAKQAAPIRRARKDAQKDSTNRRISSDKAVNA